MAKGCVKGVETMKRNFTVTLGLPTAVSTILLSYMMAVLMEGTHAMSAAPKCDVVTANSTWKRLSNGLELVFGNSKEDFQRAIRLCKSKNASLPHEGMVDSIRPCLELRNASSDDYFWIQACQDVHRVFGVTKTKNLGDDLGDEKYHNYVCVLPTDRKTYLTIQAADLSNTTYNNTETSNTFQAWTGKTLNLFCESGLKNVWSRLCINNETCKYSSNMTWTPESCENNITVICESLNCPEDIYPAGKTNVRINVQCPLEIMSFTSNSRHDTGGAGIHIYNMGDDVTFTCVTKGSTDVTILKTQGMKMEKTVSRNHAYSITDFSCVDMGTYYCVAKQGDTQVNRSINVAVSGSCPPKLCSEETQEEGSLDNETVGHPMTVCVMAYPPLSDWVTFNGQTVQCDGEISSPPWQCSIKQFQHVFMTYNFTFNISDVSLLVDNNVSIRLETKEPRGVLNLTCTLDTCGRRLYLITTTPQASLKDTTEGLSLSLAVIISIILIVIVLIAAGFILGVLYRKMKGKHQSYSYHRPLSPMSNHSGHVNRGSENTDELELHSSGVHVGLHLSCPTPIHERQDSQQSEESRHALLRPVEGEPNASLYQNLSEAKCTSTVGVYANLSDLTDMPGPSQRLASQPATNSALKAKGQNGYHPMTPVSSSPTAGSYVSQEGLVYITVDHSVSSGNTRSALDRQREFNERDSIQYARLDFTNTGKYDIRRDKMKLKTLKHERHN